MSTPRLIIKYLWIWIEYIYIYIYLFSPHKWLIKLRRQFKLDARSPTNWPSMPAPRLSTCPPEAVHSSHLLLIWVNVEITSVAGGAPKRKLRNKDNTWYPADDEKTHHKRRRNQPKAIAGRSSIVAGQVVILLSGSHRGRRVVVLKSLASGNLLVTGPYSVNGVPLKRVNPAYVIATSSKVPLDGVSCNIDDSYFKKQIKFTKDQLKNASETRNKKSQEGKDAEEKWKAAAKNVQKGVDAKLIENIKKIEHFKGYLSTRFTLSANSRPHELKFWFNQTYLKLHLIPNAINFIELNIFREIRNIINGNIIFKDYPRNHG